MGIEIRDKELYEGLEKDLRMGKRTKEELIKLACDNAYWRVELEREINQLKSEIQKLKNEQPYQSVGIQKIKNERGAGRKPIDKKIVEDIERARIGGASIRTIAIAYDVSVGTVHNVLKASNIN